MKAGMTRTVPFSLNAPWSAILARICHDRQCSPEELSLAYICSFEKGFDKENLSTHVLDGEESHQILRKNIIGHWDAVMKKRKKKDMNDPLPPVMVRLVIQVEGEIETGKTKSKASVSVAALFVSVHLTYVYALLEWQKGWAQRRYKGRQERVVRVITLGLDRKARKAT
jgi:hypothetical protein